MDKLKMLMQDREMTLFDCIMTEIMDERMEEKAKVRNRRKADRKHPENKAERKKEKQNRMHRLYGLAYEDTKYGKTVFFWDKKEGQKKFPEYEAEIFRNIKERSAEKVARADFDAEIRQHEDAMQEYADYCLMAEQHEERLEYLRNLTGNVEFWEIMINEISREKIYEENRIREMRNIANNIMKGECY